MTIERNKRIAGEFFSRFNAKDIEGALDTMADDATWWIAGRPASTPVAGTRSKTQIGRIFHRMVEQTADGLRMTVKDMTAGGAARPPRFAPAGAFQPKAIRL